MFFQRWCDFTEYLQREELASFSPHFHYSVPSSEDLLVIYTCRSEKRFKLCSCNYTEWGRKASRTEVGGFWGWGCFCTAVLPAQPFEPLQSETKQMQLLWSQSSLSPGLLFDSQSHPCFAKYLNTNFTPNSFIAALKLKHVLKCFSEVGPWFGSILYMRSKLISSRPTTRQCENYPFIEI